MYEKDLLENVAAISAEFHGDEETYLTTYEQTRDEVCGFTGLWAICADVGKAFTDAEQEIVEEKGEDYFDWIAAVGETARCLHDYLRDDESTLVNHYGVWLDRCKEIIEANKH